MADVKAVLLQTGKNLFSAALSGVSLVTPHSFKIGDMAGFTPDSADTAPRGNNVFSAGIGLIQFRQIAADTVRYTMTLPESVGPFDVGNVVMYGTLVDNSPVPLVSVVLPFKYNKVIATGSSNQGGVPTPGSRFVINVTIKHSLDSQLVSVTITTPLFSSLGFFEDQFTIPASSGNPWNQFVIHNDTRLDTPSLIMKRTDGAYFGIPFWKRANDPKFNVFSGGVIGDNYKSDIPVFFGNYYLTPEDKYRGDIGGGSYTQDDNQFAGDVGGATYT